MRHEFSPLSPIAFYACGTLSEIIQLDLFHGARIRGYINDDRLALDASQSGVARNTRYGTLVEILNRQAQGLILATIEAHSQSFPQTGRLLLEPAAARIWQERFQHGIAAETAWGRKLRRLKMAGPIAALFGYDVARRAEFISRIHKDARTTLWLRALSSNSLSAYDKDRTDPALKALWEAPVFFGTFGESISRLDIANMNHRLGYVRYSLRPSRKPAAAGSTRTLWVLTGNDKHCLADLCGNKLRDVLLDPT
ncbi:MAG: hypothetical protein HY922_17510 [Elusimicrobia bacterium]|nr:hypothetical protein [Elusimicrobiota bacterium]